MGVSIGVVGSVAGGLISSSGSKSAAKAAAGASDRAAQVQWDMYDQSRKDMAPWRDVGQSALYEIADLYGLQRPNVTINGQTGQVEGQGGQQNSAQTNQQSNGYDRSSLLADWMIGKEAFGKNGSSDTAYYPTFSQLEDAIKNDRVNRLAYYSENPELVGMVERARGAFSQPSNQGQQQSAPQTEPEDVTSRQQNALSRFNTSPDYQFRLSEGQKAIERSAAARGGLFSGSTGKALTQYGGNLASGEFNNYVNRLASLAGVGQSQSQNIAALGQNAASNMGAAYQQAGQARASGYLGQANTLNNALNNYQMYNAMGGGGFGGGGFGGGGGSTAFNPNAGGGGTNWLPTSGFSLGYQGG